MTEVLRLKRSTKHWASLVAGLACQVLSVFAGVLLGASVSAFWKGVAHGGFMVLSVSLILFGLFAHKSTRVPR